MTASPEPALAGPLPPALVRSILFGVLLAMFLSALDQTIVATALPTIGADLGDVELLPWVVTAYLLTSTAVTPLYGKLSDIHGRRPVLISAILIFIFGSVLCAVAPTMLVLVIARAIQGLGGGGLVALSQTVIADIATPRERMRFMGYISSVFMVSSIAGPVLGGVFAEHLHWSLIFWINVPLGGVAFALTFNRLRHLPRVARPHRLDIPGALLMFGATILLLVLMENGGRSFSWLSPQAIGLGVAAVVAWGLFSWRIARAPEPFLPLDVLFEPVVVRVTIASFFTMGVFIALIIYVPVFLEMVVGLPAGRSGLAMMPMMLMTVVGSATAGKLMGRMTHYKRPTLVSLAVSFLVLASFTVLPAVHLVDILVRLMVVGFGLGTCFPVMTVSVQNAVAPHQVGTATAVMNFFRSLGGAIMVAGFGAILLGPDGGSSGFPADVATRFPLIFAASAAGLGIGFISLFLMEERPFRERHEPVHAAEG